MKRDRRKLLSWLMALLLFVPACGGGSAGTGVGPAAGGASFSGQIVSKTGEAIAEAQITLLNTAESTVTDRAGAFELNTQFPGGTAEFEIKLAERLSAEVSVRDVEAEAEPLQLAFLFDQSRREASLLEFSLRARIVRSCAPQFFNAQTIKQQGSIPPAYPCTVEVLLKQEGQPVDKLNVELQVKACSDTAKWRTLSKAITGSSGPGTAEINFPYFSDEQHCVYRLRGPLSLPDALPLSAQIITLSKQAVEAE